MASDYSFIAAGSATLIQVTLEISGTDANSYTVDHSGFNFKIVDMSTVAWVPPEIV